LLNVETIRVVDISVKVADEEGNEVSDDVIISIV
jgi:hypothetical protein